jgi:3-oxoacyl-[acyl-carrier protein] reductase
LADAGAHVVVNDLLAPALDGVVAQLRERTDRVLPIAADVTIWSDVRRMFDEARDALGPVEILVNNAGVLRPTRFVDIGEDEWTAVVDTNSKGTFRVYTGAVPQMQGQGGGRIINLSSTVGRNLSTVGGAHCPAVKAGVLGLTRHLANEVAKDGITVNAVYPGLIDTDMVRSTISAAAVERYASSFPISRLGRPGEVVDLIVFLASDQAAYITGASVGINGGDLMV